MKGIFVVLALSSFQDPGKYVFLLTEEGKPLAWHDHPRNGRETAPKGTPFYRSPLFVPANPGEDGLRRASGKWYDRFATRLGDLVQSGPSKNPTDGAIPLRDGDDPRDRGWAQFAFPDKLKAGCAVVLTTYDLFERSPLFRERMDGLALYHQEEILVRHDGTWSPTPGFDIGHHEAKMYGSCLDMLEKIGKLAA